MSTKSKKVLAKKSSKIEKHTNAKAEALAEAGRPTINAVVRAFAEMYEEQAKNPPETFNPDEHITLTLGELALFVAAVRSEETGWDSWVAAEAVKQMLPTKTVLGTALPLYAFFKERAERHAMIARATGKPPTINPMLAKWLHGNPQLKSSAK